MENQKVTTTKSDGKKSSKPIMEKRRRARINASLAELKSLLLDAIKKEGTRHAKMEKADILELAVRHLKEIQTRPFSAMTSPSSAVLSKYVMGFQACAAEVSKYLSTDGEEDFTLKTKLLNHLANCLADDEIPFTSSNIGSSSSPSSIHSSSMEDTPADDSRMPTSSSALPASNILLKSLHENTSLIKRSLSSTKTILLSMSGPDADKDSLLNQSQVSSSTQPSTRLSVSSSSSSSSINFLSPQSDECPAADQISPHVENKQRKSLRESIIVTKRTDEENDDGVMFSDVDEDEHNSLIVTAQKQDINNSHNSVNQAGETKRENDDNNNDIRYIPLSAKMESGTSTNLITLPPQNLNGLTLSTMPILPQNMLNQQVPQQLQHIQQLIPQQQHIQTPTLLPQQQQQIQTPTLLPQQQIQTPTQQSLDQIYIGAMKTLPCVGQNVQLLQATQTNPKEIAFVLPANILSSGNIPKFYIPVMPPSTLQTSATIIAPHVFQPNQVSTVQLETVETTPQQPNHIITSPHGDMTKDRTKEDLSRSEYNNIFFLNSEENIAQHQISSEKLPVNIHIKQQNGSTHETEPIHAQSISHNPNLLNLVSGMNTPYSNINVYNENSRFSLSTSSLADDTVSMSSQQLTDSLQEMKQQKQHLDIQQRVIENSSNQSEQTRVDFHTQQHTTRPDHRQGRATDVSRPASDSTFPALTTNHLSNIYNRNDYLANPISVITPLHISNSGIVSNLKPITTHYNGISPSSIISPNFKTTDYRKRQNSPSHDFIDENPKRPFVDCEQLDKTRNSSVLDLSIPRTRNESSAALFNNSDDSPLKMMPSFMNNTSSMEGTETNSSAKVNRFSKGSFFRPW